MSVSASNTRERRRPPNMFQQLAHVLGGGTLWTFGLVVFVLGGLVMSWLVEWTGMATGHWDQPGAGHAKYMFRKELGYIDSHAVRGLFTDSPSTVARNVSVWMGDVLSAGPSLQRWLDRYLQPVLYDDTEIVRWLKWARYHGTEYAVAAQYIGQVYIVRCLIILYSVPLFALVTILAVQDGLIERERRKAGAGIESSSWYHRMKKTRSIVLLLPLAFYLSSPWPTPPGLVLVPVALAFGTVIYQFTKSYKGRL